MIFPKTLKERLLINHREHQLSKELRYALLRSQNAILLNILTIISNSMNSGSYQVNVSISIQLKISISPL